MNDLEVKVSQQPGIINCNLEEIKEALKVQMTAYMDLEVTEGNIKESKSDLATLRKIKKAVDDRRKEVKRTACQYRQSGSERRSSGVAGYAGF